MGNGASNLPRRFNRQMITEPAWITFGDDQPGKPIKCTVRDISINGAKLQLDDARIFPGKFELHLHGESQPLICRATWRKGHVLGVAFV